MAKILLSTYTIKVLDNSKNEQILSKFNGSDDFFNFFQNYLETILKNVNEFSDESKDSKLHLTLENKPTIIADERSIYGYFSSGVSGESYKIKDVTTQDDVFAVDNKKHGAFRDLFFYIKLPSNKKSGALVLQRKSKFGIKTLIYKTLNKYMRNLGYQKYNIEINNTLHGKVYRKMIEFGKLKKVEFIRKKIPTSIEKYFNNNGELEETKGVLKTSMLSSSGLPQTFKDFLNNLFTKPEKERIEIKEIDQEFDEIEFELDLNGKNKTFYVHNRAKIQPDIDVTNELEYDNNGNPTTQSLIVQSEELIRDIILIDPNSVI